MINWATLPSWFFSHDGQAFPRWFFGYDAYLQAIFTIVTFLLGFLALRVYHVYNRKYLFFLGSGFLIMSVSYLLWTILNLTVLSDSSSIVCTVWRVCNADTFFIYLHLSLFIIGLLMITLVNLEIKDLTTGFLITLISISSLMVAANTARVFYMICSVLLMALAIHYYRNFCRIRSRRSFKMFLSFTIIALGYIQFVFGFKINIFYITGNLFELVGYLILLSNLIGLLNVKKDGSAKKKRPYANNI